MTSDKGLNDSEIKARLNKYGPNEIAEGEKISLMEMLISQFKDIMVIILLFAVVISVVVANRRDESPIEAIVISIIVIFNAVFGFVQEYRSEKALEALKSLAAQQATVVRDGEIHKIFARELVPGDLILLEVGDRIPADVRITESLNLQVDEAILTGESIPVWKTTTRINNIDIPVADRINQGFLGTLVTFGRGKGFVVETGMRTEFGKIADMIQEVVTDETPLQKNLDTFGKQLAAIILILTGLVFLAEVYRATNINPDLLIDMFIIAIALAVAAIPEGLPAVVTITLALGVKRMVKRNSVVRRLPAVETLGSTSVICSDKTGTITKNEMTVRKIYVNRETIEITGSGYEPTGTFLSNGKIIDPLSNAALTRLLEIGTLCNNASIQEDDKQKILGDPTEGALIVVADKGGRTQEILEKEYPIITELSFDSTRKRMTTIHQTPQGKKIAFVKGAPEIIIKLSTSIYESDSPQKITSEDKELLIDQNRQYAGDALRVLAFAYKILPEELSEYTVETIESDLIFVGLAGMIDPPRDEVRDAIKKANNAGINIKMITGDHALTAQAVAQEVGLETEKEGIVTGTMLNSMDNKTLDKVLDSVTVFARVDPEHKVRIVDSIKKKGHVVAMTGDGVNDAPAVKHADIGISMGIRGTDVTKEASDMVLVDDNFATIVAAIEEGRGVYSNINKFIRYLLAANTSEVLVVFIVALLGLRVTGANGSLVPVLPLTAIQLLWINLVTDGFPALALGVDPPNPDIMTLPPRNPKENILSKDVLIFILSIGVLGTISTLAVFLWKLDFQFSTLSIDPQTTEETLIKAKTMAFTTLVLFELLFVFSVRSETRTIFGKHVFNNKYLILAVLISISLQLATIYIPAFHEPFDTTYLNFGDWFVILVVSLPTLFVAPKYFLKSK